MICVEWNLEIPQNAQNQPYKFTLPQQMTRTIHFVHLLVVGALAAVSTWGANNLFSNKAKLPDSNMVNERFLPLLQQNWFIVASSSSFQIFFN